MSRGPFLGRHLKETRQLRSCILGEPDWGNKAWGAKSTKRLICSAFNVGASALKQLCPAKTISAQSRSKCALIIGSNEKEISHGRVSWQTHKAYFDMGPLASSIC